MKQISIEELLERYFEEDDFDDEINYSVKDGYLVRQDVVDEVVIVSVSHDGNDFATHTVEYGRRSATKEQILKLAVYKLERVQ